MRMLHFSLQRDAITPLRRLLCMRLMAMAPPFRAMLLMFTARYVIHWLIYYAIYAFDAAYSLTAASDADTPLFINMPLPLRYLPLHAAAHIRHVYAIPRLMPPTCRFIIFHMPAPLSLIISITRHAADSIFRADTD